MKSHKTEYLISQMAGDKLASLWKDNNQIFQTLKEQKAGEADIAIRFLRLGKSSVVLDYGIGMGLVAEPISKIASRVYGWDTDPEMLEYCKNTYVDNNKIHLLPINQSLDDLKNLGINVIIANCVIGEYYTISELPDLLSKFSDILPSGGMVWFDWKNRAHKADETDMYNKDLYSTLNDKTFDPKQMKETLQKCDGLRCVFNADRKYISRTLLKKF